MIYSLTTASPEETQAIAARLAKLLVGGEVIELTSDLGGGKTTFVQGLVHGLGYRGDVTSPTFVLNRIYEISPALEVHHYDLYRLGTEGIMGDELSESISDDTVVTVIEWAQVAADRLPHDRLQITFDVTGESGRTLQFTASGPRSSRLLSGVTS